MISLNSEQNRAANFRHGVASVIAVPGSGKTLTMSHRIAYLVKDGVAPENILGLTFTRNSADAMRSKLQPILADQASRVTLSTIHSFCYGLLQSEGRVFEMLSGLEQLRFIRDVMKKLKIKNIPVGFALREIGLAKNNMIEAGEFRELYEGDETMQKIADVYEGYEIEKRRRGMLDFNDLLTEAKTLLTTVSDIRERYQQTFKHILVDEFQDTNPAQMEIVNLLVGDIHGKIGTSFWVSGDDWQSIYAFTGASIGNILNFKKMFPGSQQFILDVNYRSTPQILRACQRLIEHNVKKIDKTLRTNNSDGDDVMVIAATNEEDEAVKIVTEIKDLIARKNYAHKDIAILYRANSQSRLIEEAFSQHKIPYHIENGTSFYQRHEVKVLLDYLRLINDPNSEDGNDALKSVINCPNRYIGAKFMIELEEYADQQGKHLYEALKSMPISVPYLRKFIREFRGVVQPLMNDNGNIEPAELIHLLRESLDYDKFITDDDIPSPDDNKIQNINQLQIAASKYSDIGSLLNYTDTFKDEMSNDKEGISLMTIHKSKGLEFPVVFVIGMIDGILPSARGDIEEERRITFVAMSRAMLLLYLTYSQKHLNRNVNCSPFLTEIEGGHN